MATIDLHTKLDIKRFIEESILNDSGEGKGSNGPLRLNRFVGAISVKHLKKSFEEDKHNNEIEDWGNDFLLWNIFKIDVPRLAIDVEQKELDGIPRYIMKNWVHDDLTVSYLESTDLKIRHYFFEWMQSALHTTTFSRRYYDQVMSPWFAVYPLNATGQAERVEIFRDLVPVEIDSINFDVQDDGHQVYLTKVKFKYIAHDVLSISEL